MNDLELKYFGRMTDPDGGAYTKGVCGDEMEFFIFVKDKIITDVKFYTEGCEHTKLCGEATAKFVMGKSIEEAMRISPRYIQDSIKDLPLDHVHCLILSTITFLKALADYLYEIDLG